MNETTIRRYPPAKILVLGLTGIAVAAGMVLGTIALIRALSADGPAATAQLRAWNLPGLRVGLPDWEVRESTEAPPPGVIRVVDAAGDGRFMEARWAVGQSLAPQSVVSAVDEALRETSREEVSVDGRPAELVRYGAAGAEREVALTSWLCPATGVGAYLLSAHPAGDEGALATYHRALASVDCAPLVHGEAPDPVYPVVAIPEGYREVEGQGVADGKATLVWEGEDKDLFTVLQGSPGKRRAAGLAADDKLRAQMLRAELGLKDIHFDEDPRALRESVDKREVWRATARDGAGVKVRALLTYWHCADTDLSFAAVHVGPMDLPIEPPTDLLTNAACPPPRPQP